MEGRNQRCPLPAPRHIATAEISDSSNAGHGGNAVVIAQLHRKRSIAFRLMPDRLPVAANRGDFFR